MKKAWSFFWFVVASCVAFVIIASLIEPYWGVICAVIVLIVLGFIGWEVYRRLSGRTRHF